MGWHVCNKALNIDLMKETEEVIIKNVQDETYSEEIKCINSKLSLPTVHSGN